MTTVNANGETATSRKEEIRAAKRRMWHKIYYSNIEHGRLKKREAAKKRRANNPDLVNSTQREWRKKNLDKVRAAARAHYLKNKDAISKRRSELRLAKQDSERERARLWRENNHEKMLALSRKHRALRARGEGPNHTAEQLDELFKRQRGRCAYCRCKLSKANRHRDHIVALSRGGDNSIKNMQWLCGLCNQRKHAKDPLTFAQQNGLLL